jgi:light-harvesting complex I chlorophyll a/b binding protein 1
MKMQGSELTEGERYCASLEGGLGNWPWRQTTQPEQSAGLGLGLDQYFDPLGLTAGAKPADVKKWRESEIKHGRLAMLAVVGTIVQEQFHPFFLTESNVGPAIYHFQEINSRYPVFGYLATLAIGIVEGETIVRGWQKTDQTKGIVAPLKDSYTPGDLGFDPLGLGGEIGSEQFKNYRRQELNNGRVAMIGLAGIIAQELVDKKGIIEHWVTKTAATVPDIPASDSVGF